jgi:hypothetical protein
MDDSLVLLPCVSVINVKMIIFINFLVLGLIVFAYFLTRVNFINGFWTLQLDSSIFTQINQN